MVPIRNTSSSKFSLLGPLNQQWRLRESTGVCKSWNLLLSKSSILHIVNFLFQAIMQLPFIFNNQQTQDRYIYLQGKRKKHKTKVVLSARISSYLVKDSETIIISQLYSFTNILGSLLRTAKLPTYITHLCVSKPCSVHVKLFNIATM